MGVSTQIFELAMRTANPEKILKIIEDIETQGNASMTRLTVLKKWFEASGRLAAFGLWLARRAAGRKGKTKGAASALLDETRALLGTSSTRKAAFHSTHFIAGILPQQGASLRL